MLTTRYAAATLLLGTLAACGGGAEEPATPRPLEFSVLDSSDNGNIRAARFAMAKSDVEWKSLWSEYKGAYAKPAPAVDFHSRMVVGVFTGERPVGCDAAAIRRVIREESSIRVEYALVAPPAQTACGGAFTAPAVVAEVPHSDLPVSFTKVPQ
ncbi:hypothetical protein [Ramlibacter albus]|uniref:Protease complex subunit PrcB family protein n=1 Tax=Ramlibacter albus TaxID=2079448 RepID=A0A923S252_9BURK|nr:hypothetical protein [Ramlibacter albus]MBC5765124.1 hypothetical protein [Ramlibacter albus]